MTSPADNKSWLKRTLIGRTPSLPSSLGKSKQTFLKKLQGRKISAPSFAASLRPLRNGASSGGAGATPPPHPSQSKPPSSPCASASPSSSRMSFCTQSCSSTPAECRRRRHSSSASSDTAADEAAVRLAAAAGHDQASPPIFFFCGAASDQRTSSSSLLNTPVAQITSLEEASGFIEELRAKLRAQGQQVIAYRRKLRQQRAEMSEVRHGHRRQLEDIAAKLLYFESSLRSKEKCLQDTLATKDQVIAQQKRIIRKLLKKCYGKSVLAARESEQEILMVAAERIRPAIAITAQSDYDAQNDSDSAVILEDNLHEVSLVVPSGDISDSNETRVCRSISDVVKVSTEQKQWQQNKAKEERRISNRQKLLALKRHSGHLKRPEILETVYSVEEDGELQQQQQQQQQQQAKPSFVGRGSVLLQNRFDSDVTVSDADYSTDDDSTRIFCSDTTTDASVTTSCCCSQSCSRRSSCAVQGFCSSPCSRRSSWGGDAGRRPILVDADSETESKCFNRIMGTNHRAVTKPKDIKFKRISKAKSRSLEELRGKLRGPLKSSSEEASDV